MSLPHSLSKQVRILESQFEIAFICDTVSMWFAGLPFPLNITVVLETECFKFNPVPTYYFMLGEHF